jgi:hypothetical protein
MTNAIISLVLTVAIGATLGGQIATAAAREGAVRATLVTAPAPDLARRSDRQFVRAISPNRPA